jgi:Uma2 family endonuclease
MVSQPLKAILPSTEELPCSDDTPVDNEDQNLLPNLLLFALTLLWAERMDWYFGVDMAVYHTTGVSPKVPVVPDAFLSLGVERKKGGKSRRSYATWEEHDTVPIWVLEMVSHRPNDEYDEKLELYARLGVLYYVIYNPEFWQRDRHQPFEVYKLEGQTYRLQIGEPYWMPEVGLGIGRGRQVMGGIEQEVLLWYDAQGRAYPMPDEVLREMQMQLRAERQRAEQEQQRAEAEQQRAEEERQRAEEEQQRAEIAEEKANRLAQRLRELGIDPDQV